MKRFLPIALALGVVAVLCLGAPSTSVSSFRAVSLADWLSLSNTTNRYTDNGSALLRNGVAVGGSAPAGTVINSGASGANALPRYVDATGTNVAPTSVTITANTNVSAGSFIATNNVRVLTLTGDRALVSDANGNLTNSPGVTTTELNFLDGVTSAVQTQFAAKAPTASPTFTGLVTLGTLVPGLDTPSHYWRGFGANSGWPVTLSTIYDANSVDQMLTFNGYPDGGTKAATTFFGSGSGGAFIRDFRANTVLGSRLQFGTFPNGSAQTATVKMELTQAGELILTPTAGTNGFTTPSIKVGSDLSRTSLKRKVYLNFGMVDTVDGVGATIQTAASELKNRVIFSHSADQAANWGLWNFPAVPEDLDTAVDLKIERFKFVLGGADTGTHRYVISMYSGADSAIDYTTTINAINLDFAGDPSGANADMETISNVTLTAWRTSLTAGNSFFVKVARDGDAAQDTSTVNSWLSGFVISYTSSQ